MLQYPLPDATTFWLIENAIQIEKLKMTSKFDSRAHDVMKLEWIESNGKSKSLIKNHTEGAKKM